MLLVEPMLIIGSLSRQSNCEEFVNATLERSSSLPHRNWCNNSLVPHLYTLTLHIATKITEEQETQIDSISYTVDGEDYLRHIFRQWFTLVNN